MKQHAKDFTQKWPDMQRSQCISSQFTIPATLVNSILEAAFESWRCTSLSQAAVCKHPPKIKQQP